VGDVAVVIPAHQEAERVAATVLASAGIHGVDLVVVVDDGSTDATADLATESDGSGSVDQSAIDPLGPGPAVKRHSAVAAGPGPGLSRPQPRRPSGLTRHSRTARRTRRATVAPYAPAL
jgi:cellulose synthase/poly-beta-1,6-N-acetylglucosamine synthase-like glycosyltransferase